MSAYRFCRTDDVALLVDALNRCWAPYRPDEPLMTPAAFKRWIRDQQVWCSSCMVAFSGADPVGVLIGAKRPSGTLVHTIAVHPDHRRKGHGRHLLTSLASKLAILGPPRLVAEVPASFGSACELFGASGYVQEAVLTDYVLQDDGHDDGERPPAADEAGGPPPPWLTRGRAEARGAEADRFVIPVTVDDLAANGLLEADPEACWTRSVDTLTARKDDVAGLAVASDERLEAYVLYVPPPPAATEGPTEIVALRSCTADGDGRLAHLLSRLQTFDRRPLVLPRVHPTEFPPGRLEALGFRPVGACRRYAAQAGAGQARVGQARAV